MQHAADAVRLRGWALGVLSGAEAAAPPRVSARAWEVFLLADACGLILSRRLSPAARLLLDDTAARTLQAATLRDQQRFLTAQSQARQLAAWALRSGRTLVVLKGGLAAVTGEPQLGLLDLDVLVPEGRESLAEFMDGALGYRAGADLEGAHHLGQRARPGGVQVEVHRFLKELTPSMDRLRPLLIPGLHALAADEHAWHVLVHGAVSHRERRGRIRDLVLLGAALAECGDEELQRLRARAAAHPRGGLLLAVMDAAHAVAEGRPLPDRFVSAAAGRYLTITSLLPLGLPRRFLRDTINSAFSALEGGGDLGAYWSHVARSGSGARTLVQLPWRMARLALASLPAAWLALSARRLAAGAGH
jgi:hypothetical protein